MKANPAEIRKRTTENLIRVKLFCPNRPLTQGYFISKEQVSHTHKHIKQEYSLPTYASCINGLN
jgi:hypothetical protein